uniref:U92-Liphistoxin-Lth1a_1 n=1 Tax=Liphistius thaleban TaxID=1905330 RepID=A0A4V2H8N0_9ARAC
MIASWFLLFIGAAVATPLQREKRAAYTLPDGAELLVGRVHSTFNCFNNGYYADVDNNCQIFHICYSVANPDGTINNQQWSFVCGNQTVFNQLTFTCTHPEDSVPCIHAQDFYYLNSHLEAADPEVHFLNDQDIQRAAPLIQSDLYNRRVESPQRFFNPVRRLDFGDYREKK